MWAQHVPRKPDGPSNVFTPPTSAYSQALLCNERHAISSATRLAEQAVSTLKLGPSSPNTYEKRLDTSAEWEPVAVYGPGGLVLLYARLPNSPPAAPANTPIAL